MSWTLPPHAYRVTRDAYAQDAATALSGIGGLVSDGRWNSQGRKIVYASESATLCLLERVVHADEWIAERHADRVMLKIKLPPVNFFHYTANELASSDPNWQAEGSILCRRLGDAWLRSKATCALVVPSAANPLDHNILFNPEVDEFKDVVLANTTLERTQITLEERVVSLVREFRNRAVS